MKRSQLFCGGKKTKKNDTLIMLYDCEQKKNQTGTTFQGSCLIYEKVHVVVCLWHVGQMGLTTKELNI